MKDRDWNLYYVSWNEYKFALVSGEGEMWRKFEDADLVFGGMDFSCDFLYLSSYLIEKRLTLIFYRNPSMKYNVSPDEACSIYLNLTILGKKTTIWPHPEELFLGGSKVQCYETLRVASFSMGISTPLFATAQENIRDPNFLSEFSQGKIQGVLKREYSMKCEHVLLPTTPNLALKMKESLEVEEITWNRVKGLFGTPKWFVQPLVAHLRRVGEVRCFIVSGRLLSKITTTPGKDDSWDISDYEPIRPLHTHRLVKFLIYLITLNDYVLVIILKTPIHIPTSL